MALCKLHNFCVAHSGTGLEHPLDKDILNIMSEGGMFLPRIDQSDDAYWEYDMTIAKSRDQLGE